MAENEVAVQNEQTQVANTTKKVCDFSLGIFGSSDNFIMADQMAKALARSTIVPRAYQNNSSNCMIAVELAQRLGISPMMVMQNLYVIQGNPAWSSQFLIACINNSKKFDIELQYEEEFDKAGKPYSCTCWTTKNGRTIKGMKITMDMAIAEGWVAKNGSKWKTMPQLMLRYRAASFFARLNAPELTMGLYTEEEMIDGDFKEYPIEELTQEKPFETMMNPPVEDNKVEEFVEAEQPKKTTKKSSKDDAQQTLNWMDQ